MPPSIGTGRKGKEMASLSAKALRASNGEDGTMLRFLAKYSTEEACEEAVMEARFPDGYRCPRCGCEACSPVRNRPHKRQCPKCRRQFSVLAGTAMQGTHLPLTKWFLAFYLATHSKRGISALELARHLGVCEKTGGYLLLRVRGAMARSECLQGA